MASISYSPFQILQRIPILNSRPSSISVARPCPPKNGRSFFAVVAVADAKRRLYVGNIPRDVTNDQLKKIFAEHGSVDKAEVMYDKYSGRSRRFGFVTMTTFDDVSSAIEKLHEKEIGGRKIKVNVTEKPIQAGDQSPTQVGGGDSGFVDSPYKVYVGNLAKTVTSELLKKFFSEKGKVLGAKVSRIPGTSKGFAFVTFSSEDRVQAAIQSFNNALLEGQKIRVNKA